MLKYFIFFLLLLISACGHFDDSGSSAAPIGVEVAQHKREIVINVDERKVQQGVGPFYEEIEQQTQKKVREPIIALYFPNDPNIFVTGLKLVRSLFEKGIKPRIFSGDRTGAVLATMLAFNLSPDEIEWKLFALEREGLKDEKKRLEFLLKDYKTKKIESSYHILMLPQSNDEMLTRGNLVESVERQYNSLNINENLGPRMLGADLLFKLGDATIETIVNKILAWKQASGISE